ncbi:MAG: alcohol dehydrogenase catalytic domain-containing protein [Candidatus Eremiobacteraeota bacterium]|nr:alcohol dehydrogenase catalytic domain-containing protein [Candidatus Eremiobacteraeota bacterium]
MPQQMRAAVLYDVDDVRIEQREIPQIGDGEVLVQTMASGICSGDVMGWYIRRKAPLVLGHEPAGIVAQTRGETGLQIGDRVFVHHHAPCFECRACTRKEYVQCATWRATKIDPGGIAEYFRVPHTNLRDTLVLPADVGFADASLVEPLACVVKSLRRSGVRASDRLYVIGLGVMGLLHVLAATALGAEVFASDFIEGRRAIARQNGATAFHPDEAARELGAGADVVICGPGTPRAIHAAVAATAPAGTVVMFTPFPPETPVTIDPELLYFGDLRIVASYSCGPDDTRAALDLIARGVVRAAKIGSDFVALEDVPDAYRALAESRIVKPIVTFAP